MEPLCQVLIVLTGVPASWLIGRLERWKKWGYIIGMAGQPAWFYVTINGEQWGLLLLALWYTYAWAQGVYNYFLRSVPIINQKDRSH